MQREAMEVDVVIIGAGPAGLSSAIRLGQLAKQHGRTLNICVLEKAAEVGAHTLSGAILEPRALQELFPNWQDLGAPVTTAVTQDEFLLLSTNKAYRLPTPSHLHNQGNYIISLGNLCRWLAEQAEQLGIEIYPGFAATEILYDETGQVKGVATGDMGIDKNGKHRSHYQPGMALHAKYTLFGEGCRGSLTKNLMKKFNLNQSSEDQTYGLGVKEIWEIEPAKHQRGKVTHTLGWPLNRQTYGGSFIYHLENNHLAIGVVVGLDYQNPSLSPFHELQRLKHHPAIRPLFDDGKRIAYGARALNEGGYQSIPKLSFPGGMLIGCSAGFLNVAKIKGNHTAMKSGMLAAESTFAHLQNEAADYDQSVKSSWIYPELKAVRNIRPGFKKGLWWGLINAAVDTYVFRGKAPWTLRHHVDHLRLKQNLPTINYPKPDGKISFDRLSSVFLAGVNHHENQPVHLQLKQPELAIDINYRHYGSPEQYYCPAGVYEIIELAGQPTLQINAANCVHCKTCDIKDPKQNITWVPPEGGSGPNYRGM